MIPENLALYSTLELMRLRTDLDVILDERAAEKKGVSFEDLLRTPEGVAFAEEFKALNDRFKALRDNPPPTVRRELSYDFTLSFRCHEDSLAQLMEHYQDCIFNRAIAADLKITPVNNDLDLVALISSAELNDCEDLAVSFNEAEVIDRKYAKDLMDWGVDVNDFVKRVRVRFGDEHLMYTDLFKNIE
jgi:hypothetical protein